MRRTNPWPRPRAREVREETGIRGGTLSDWGLTNVYEIYPVWRHRYAPGVTHNTEHVFGLTVEPGTPVVLDPREHLHYQWLPWREAADRCFSPSNAEAILHLPRLAGDRPMNALNPLKSTLLPSAERSGTAAGTLRVATYNIHKGVRGVGPRKRLEIHNLGLAVESFDADLVFLQEVRLHHAREARRFERTSFGWPAEGQADFLAPEGYDVAYRTNARHALG